MWRYLKRRLKELGLTSAPPHWRGDGHGPPPPTPPGTGTVVRSKVDCFRVCERGPIAVVYPDGVWYTYFNRDDVDRIVDEHLINGRIVEDLRI